MGKELTKREIICSSTPVIRETGDGAPSRTIEMEVIRFNERSALLADWDGYFYEVIAPGAVTNELLDSCDIKLNICHNRERILARSNNGVGTLNYDVNDKCVKAWCELPNTTDGNDILELVRRGDINGCSFEATIDTNAEHGFVKWEYTDEIDNYGEKIVQRTILQFKEVMAFTVAIDPAYPTTTATLREVQSVLPEYRKTQDADPVVQNSVMREQLREMREQMKHILE